MGKARHGDTGGTDEPGVGRFQQRETEAGGQRRARQDAGRP